MSVSLDALSHSLNFHTVRSRVFGFWNITTLVISRRHGIDEIDGQTIVFNAKKKELINFEIVGIEAISIGYLSYELVLF